MHRLAYAPLRNVRKSPVPLRLTALSTANGAGRPVRCRPHRHLSLGQVTTREASPRRAPPASADVRTHTAPASVPTLLAEPCNASPIQTASATHFGAGSEELRRTVANLAKTSAIDNPSRSSRLAKSAQSPLAADRHQAPRRRTAISVSLFWPGNSSKMSENNSSMLAARAIRRSEKASTRSPGLCEDGRVAASSRELARQIHRKSTE